MTGKLPSKVCVSAIVEDEEGNIGQRSGGNAVLLRDLDTPALALNVRCSLVIEPLIQAKESAVT
jgi:hypothetical protein